MTAGDTLRALAAGTAAPVLPACRLESGNTDHFGAEAIADAFRRAPLTDLAVALEAPGHLALFGETQALFADLHGAHIARLWRIGQPDPGAGEPAVSVAFDTDLHQARADLFIAATDHPALDPAALPRLRSLALALLAGSPGFRTRAFAVRAFGTAGQGAALLALHALAANPVRAPSLTMAALRWDGEDSQTLCDPLIPRDLRIRIVA
ncbi:hypothetical protein [Sandaracinobacteroides saxicola]|uniref:Uncharacterized protein n=1 Tax=Sandaracinobacteroides saxicola TaxID=2759707 RepID=A0A7G5IEU3_9SPHN|nr:hypothetical protein [Sandaracinobacteroides saxicola]QMW21885.1 hypothetical protein H3309_10850 [Sandaracinobacteroides saxicola]